jgi:hypothetical protein
MIYPRLAFILVLFALTLLGSAHAQQAVTPAPQTVTPRVNVGVVAIEAQQFFVHTAPQSSPSKAEGSRPHARHDRCWNECGQRCGVTDLRCRQSCTLVCE